MGSSSCLPLPESILNRKAVVNPQNIGRQCFKWAILARHVASENRARVGANFSNEEYRYDFSALSVPPSVSEIKLFERANPGTSVNVYGVKNCKKNKKKLIFDAIGGVPAAGDRRLAAESFRLFVDRQFGEK